MQSDKSLIRDSYDLKAPTIGLIEFALNEITCISTTIHPDQAYSNKVIDCVLSNIFNLIMDIHQREELMRKDSPYRFVA